MFLKPLRKIPVIIPLISGGFVAHFLIKLNLSVIWVPVMTMVVMVDRLEWR